MNTKHTIIKAMIRTAGIGFLTSLVHTTTTTHAFTHTFTLTRKLTSASTYALLQSTRVTTTAPIHTRSTSTSTSTSIPASIGGIEQIPDDYPNRSIVQPAIAAIRKAARITTHLQPHSVTSDKKDEVSGITKKDASPVTIGDFAAQAIVLNLLEQQQRQLQQLDDNKHHHNVRAFVAEESSSNLSNELSEEIMHVLHNCGLDDQIPTIEELHRCIDLGQSYDTDTGALLDDSHNHSDDSADVSRVWCLDPIDGTRGFLRGKREGGQYCIALALIEDGVPIIGILGCPNLPASATDGNYAWVEDESEENNQLTRGCIFVASKGGGCYQLPLYPPEETDSGDADADADADADQSTIGAKKLQVTQNDGGGTLPLSQARFCIGVESYGDPEGKVTAIAQKIHGTLDESGDILHTRRMDSQVKYGVVARGGAEYITRLPKKEYVEWIWDHAAGRVVIEEAGGVQTDTNGDLIDYGLGAKMDAGVDGLLMSSGGIFHDAILDAYREQEEERNSRKDGSE